MPRQFFRRITADYRGKQPLQAWYLRPLEPLLRKPACLAVNRRSIAMALGIGLAVSLLPLPGHMLIALLAAIALRVNVAVAVLAVWISNPLTYGPIFYAEYRLGAWVLGHPTQPWVEEFSWDALVTGLAGAWKPLFLGSGLLAVAAGVTAYLATVWFWRWSVGLRHRQRQERRRP